MKILVFSIHWFSISYQAMRKTAWELLFPLSRVYNVNYKTIKGAYTVKFLY